MELNGGSLANGSVAEMGRCRGCNTVWLSPVCAGAHGVRLALFPAMSLREFSFPSRGLRRRSSDPIGSPPVSERKITPAWARTFIVLFLGAQLSIDVWVALEYFRRTCPFDPTRAVWSTQYAGGTILRTERNTGRVQAWMADENRWATLVDR